jgi:hypothetical protein
MARIRQLRAVQSTPARDGSLVSQCYYVGVFPSVCVTIFSLLVYALAAIAGGALTGVLASFLLGLPIFGILEDGMLGMLGFLLLGFALIFVPPLAHILINRSVAPPNVALILTPVLPFFRELCRFVRYRITSAAACRRLHQLQGQ